MITAKIIEDSIYRGHRLTTIEATYPRFIHSEVMTHRVFSRNTASSRAIPMKKQIQKIIDDAVLPVYWQANQPGMQSSQDFSVEDAELAEKIWLRAASWACDAAEQLGELHVVDGKPLGLHKQWVNRILEPFQWHTAIISSTEWQNFLNQRMHEDAQPELQFLAARISDAVLGSIPMGLELGEWHLPYILDSERTLFEPQLLCHVSAARCARVSYLTHDGVRDISEDIRLYNRLITDGHWSPLEHVATPWKKRPVRRWVQPLGNFDGWAQLRHNMNYFNSNRKKLK